MKSPSAVLTPMNATAVSRVATTPEGRMPAPPQRHPATPISPYIQEAARRAALPISVTYLVPASSLRGGWLIDADEHHLLARLTSDSATRAYLDLVNSLSSVSQ